MQVRYTDLDINFSVEQCFFTVLNLACERFSRSIPKHSHGKHSYEIHYISTGYGKAVIDGETYQITPNTLYVTGPDVEHEQIPESGNPMTEYCIFLKPDFSSKAKSSDHQICNLFECHPFWFGADRENMGVIMEQIFSEMRLQRPGYKQQVKALLQQCIVALVRNYLSEECSEHDTAEISFAHSNLYHQKYIVIDECFLYDYQNITLSGLAKRLGLSSRQTERLLKEHYGKTFLQKRNEARMSAAAILLINTDKSITEICMETGYSSVEHFSNAFRSFYHTSARNFRKENRSC